MSENGNCAIQRWIHATVDGSTMRELNGRAAVITGGASGIGLATARALARCGTRVFLADVEVDALDRAVSSLTEAGATAEGFVCDVGDRDAVHRLADAAFERMGAVHILFNNAGVAVGGPIAGMKHSDWEWTLRVNLWGAIHGVEAFVPRLIEQRQGGHVLFSASFAGLVPNVGLGPYCVSKYGVVALAEVLHRELRPHEIGVSVLCPMRVRTNIDRSERNRPRELGGPEASPRVANLGEENPDWSGGVLDVDAVAARVVDGVLADRLYILPHAESREPVRRRFARIDRAYDEQGPTTAS
jgi:NAD(P)-dependent dehydrogenase (short-subunit alcohol dehydrogenase family)